MGKSQNTKELIYTTAKNILIEKGYHKTSVNDICKSSNISNGLFYRYFKNKDDLYNYILTNFHKSFIKELESKHYYKNDIIKNIKIFITTIYEYLVNNPDKFTLFHQIEFTKTDISKKFYEDILLFLKNRVLMSEINYLLLTSLFIFTFGAIYFYLTFKIIYKKEEVPKTIPEDIINVICNGIAIKDNYYIPDELLFNISLFDWVDSNKTKDKILYEAQKQFGNKGFFKTKISEITSSLNISQGAFYVHFKSKEEAAIEIIELTNKGLKKAVKIYTIYVNDRAIKEVYGLKAFLDFFKRHKETYELVREMEYINSQATIDYYESILNGYLKSFKDEKSKEQIIKSDYETLSLSLMGINHFLGLYLIVWNMFDKKNFNIAWKEVSKFILYGLKHFKYTLKHKI